MSEHRIAELESKVAYQEVSIQELDQAVLVMQKQINELEICCQMLKDRMLEMSRQLPDGADLNERPPHY